MTNLQDKYKPWHDKYKPWHGIVDLNDDCISAQDVFKALNLDYKCVRVACSNTVGSKEKQMLISEFIKKYSIAITFKEIARRTDGNPTEWDKKARHYKVKVKSPILFEKMKFEYSCGSLCGEPDALGVLSSVQCDISLPNESFEDFCNNSGYKTDSREAYRIYEACLTMAEEAQDFFGPTLEEFLNCEE